MGKVKGFIINLDSIACCPYKFFETDNGYSFIEALELINKFKIAFVSKEDKIKEKLDKYNLKKYELLKPEEDLKEFCTRNRIDPKDIIHLSGNHKDESKSIPLSMDFIWIHGDKDPEIFKGDKMKMITTKSIDTMLSFLSLMGRC
jgi:hypothetical protein